MKIRMRFIECDVRRETLDDNTEQVTVDCGGLVGHVERRVALIDLLAMMVVGGKEVAVPFASYDLFVSQQFEMRVVQTSEMP